MKNGQSDVYTWWKPFDTPGGVWEAALMNAGRRRRDAPEPRNSSYIPVIPFTTEELERLQAGRSAHTLRAVSNIFIYGHTFSKDVILPIENIFFAFLVNCYTNHL